VHKKVYINLCHIHRVGLGAVPIIYSSIDILINNIINAQIQTSTWWECIILVKKFQVWYWIILSYNNIILPNKFNQLIFINRYIIFPVHSVQLYTLNDSHDCCVGRYSCFLYINQASLPQETTFVVCITLLGFIKNKNLSFERT